MPLTTEEKYSDNEKISKLIEQFTENTDVKVLDGILAKLKELGHNIDSYNNCTTLLMKSAGAANLLAVNFLIDNGATVNLIDSQQHTAKNYAELYKDSLRKHIANSSSLSPRNTKNFSSEHGLIALLDQVIESLEQPGLKVGSPVASAAKSILTVAK
jgi:hypothetical protein